MRQKTKNLVDLNILIIFVLLLVGCQAAFETMDHSKDVKAMGALDNPAEQTVSQGPGTTLAEAAVSGSMNTPPNRSNLQLPAQDPSPAGFIVFPYRFADAGNFILQAGEPITLTWQDPPEEAVRYEFTITPFDTGTPQTLGADSNRLDGVQIQWMVPELLGASLQGTAYFANGQVIYSNLVSGVFSGDAPPVGVCTLSAAKMGILPLFRNPASDSEPFAYLTPVPYAQVYEHSLTGWYHIDATGAFDSATGEPVMGTGWVHEDQEIKLHGPCENLS